jgi:hypothetical protein
MNCIKNRLFNLRYFGHFLKGIFKSPRLVASGLSLVLILILIWLATTDNTVVWPVRNTLQYHILIWWQGSLTRPTASLPGRLQGVVRDMRGRPIEGAWVLVAGRDGATYSTRSDAEGNYSIGNIPPGTYRPVSSAPGYDNVSFGGVFKQIKIRAGASLEAEVILQVEPKHEVVPGQDFWLAEHETVSCTGPIAGRAIRRQLHFKSDGRPNQASFYYTPVTATTTSQLPILLAIYPGPADSWECASLPLTAAGHAILAAGPAYSFDLETVIDELERLLLFAREGKFPGGDGRNIAILGGSYSSIHVLRLLERGQDVKAALLLGPPTDLFDMRRRLENGTFRPPFGLDKAFIALGLPDQEPLRYWRYSGAYHVRDDFPPLAIVHSRSDEVVPYQQSELLVVNLEKVSASYEVHFLDGAGHYLLAEDTDADTLKIYQIALDFLAKHL